MISCIYTITNILTNQIYVGYTADFMYRKTQHISALKLNSHSNNYLQNSWNLYGEKLFLFEVLEECGEDKLSALEHYWATILNTHNKKYGFNIKPTHPYSKSSKLSEESKIKLSKSRKKLIWKNEDKERVMKWGLSNKGIKRTKESIQAQINSRAENTKK